MTATGLAVGDPLVAKAGKFEKAVQGAADVTYHWVYGGTYDDPTGTMYIIERVHPTVIAKS